MFTLVAGLGLTACGSSNADDSQSTTVTPTAIVEEADTNNDETASSLTTVQGTYGYELQYDESMFDFNVTDGKDTFSLKDQDLDSEPPVYVTFTLHESTTTEDLINDTKSESGADDTEISDVIMGAGDYEAKCFTTEKSDKEKNQFITYYAVPSGDNTLLIEISAYEGADPAIDPILEVMLDTFIIK